MSNIIHTDQKRNQKTGAEIWQIFTNGPSIFFYF